ncbi:MAG: hypothetical protein KJ709_06875 [Nanoarchaeota archaeon]|nr:hypothetical protein [Nanoarchaeota archaeon]
MAGQHDIAFRIFIYMFAVFLAVLIGLWGYNNFTATRHVVNSTNLPAVRCVGYVYDIDELSYDEGMLKFKFKNQRYSSEEVTSITIRSDMEERTMDITIPIGITRDIELEMEIAKNVSIFPTGCEVYKEVMDI